MLNVRYVPMAVPMRGGGSKRVGAANAARLHVRRQCNLKSAPKLRRPQGGFLDAMRA
jgi:hypothetical protein